MDASSSIKVPTLVWSFMIKMGILALGVGWVWLVGFPSPPSPSVPAETPVFPKASPVHLSVESLSVPPGLKSSPAQSNTNRLTVLGHHASSVQPERVETKTGYLPVLDVNEATQEELERLPGLGTVLAQRILAYRQANGPFHRIEELERIHGIGHKRLQQLRPLIRMTSKKA
ncbi:MAG: helix-hairpin-helix domain-containing protein [Nitrospirales bacterium]|nr:helix-hairpin-helix domain-containing protein [Nitrospirales bacterium]